MGLQKSLLKMERSLSIKRDFQAPLQPGAVTMQPPSGDGRTLIPSFNILQNERLMHSEFYRRGVFNGCLIFNADRHHRYGHAEIQPPLQLQPSSLHTKELQLAVSMGTRAN